MRLMALAFLAVTVADGIIVYACRYKRRMLELQLEESPLDIEICLPVVENVVFTGDELIDGFSCGSTCSICLSDFAPADMLGKLPCKHVFHAGCLSSWLHSSGAARGQPGESGCPYRCGISKRRIVTSSRSTHISSQTGPTIARSSVDSVWEADESEELQASLRDDTSTRGAPREPTLAGDSQTPSAGTAVSQAISVASGVTMHTV